jgi:hypothetical protein
MSKRIRHSLKGCLLLVLFVGLIGADGHCQLALGIVANLQQQIDDQQAQIDDLTTLLCDLYDLTDNGPIPECSDPGPPPDPPEYPLPPFPPPPEYEY